MTTPTIPVIAAIAHGYMAAYDNQGPNDELWVNTELLAKATRLATCLDTFFMTLSGVYRIHEDVAHALIMPRAGPLHYAFQAVARIIAYSTAKNSPPEIAEQMVSSLLQDSDAIANHIGRHQLRLHAYSIYLFEQSPVTAESNLDETKSASRLFVKDEFRGIAAAFAIAAQMGIEPEIVNREELISKRTRVSLVV